ncbi:E3 ubiquitin-protein ligase CCNB1IP1 [Neolecta irregularis DAH-3]|uniref:E3 ubiquitin-protein ligase CCNB1IP1 n=1 Tax=Neolecta irregularis (strain DAH-3) TaxID=1198029 RepID=A0A1U7LTG7_NEOID|nr:E3 ubiquitin-protein ligase CCNB1IP1 [Neolecta irregularis DAH-3]|eukprot:OLL25966.1 E3 ubiquitin-protein ligase CCNB1IP1 [Neolecta irregularis DAH-3]
MQQSSLPDAFDNTRRGYDLQSHLLRRLVGHIILETLQKLIDVSANKLFTDERNCPACETLLGEPDDVVLTNLNPTDDYKTSVLSGLSPTIVMEICSRAMSFWSYQSTQEIVYQEFLSKTLQEKYNNVNNQLDSLIRDANAEMGGLKGQVSSLQKDNENSRKKNHELLDSLQEKSRQFHKLQLLYDKLKRKALLSPLQSAVSATVDQQAALTGHQQAYPGQTGGTMPFRASQEDPPQRNLWRQSAPRDNRHRAPLGNVSQNAQFGTPAMRSGRTKPQGAFARELESTPMGKPGGGEYGRYRA